MGLATHARRHAARWIVVMGAVAVLLVVGVPCATATTSSWDPVTRTATFRFTSADFADWYASHPAYQVPSVGVRHWPEGWTACYSCGSFPDAAKVVIEADTSVSLDLNHLDEIIGDGNELKVVFDPESQAAGKSYVDVENMAQSMRMIGMSDGLDLNGDGDTDLFSGSSKIAGLGISTGDGLPGYGGDDYIDLRALAYWFVPMVCGDPEAPGGSDYTLGIQTGGGSDTILTPKTTCATILAPGTGDTTIVTGDLRDNITTGGGNDTISSGGGNDDIDAGGGDDVVRAGAGNDIAYLWGGPGNDDFAVDRAAVHLYGGPGRDSISLQASLIMKKWIDCGAGRDEVNIPTPHMKRCEKVLFPKYRKW